MQNRIEINRIFSASVIALALTGLFGVNSFAQKILDTAPEEFKGLDVTEHLGDFVSEDIRLINEAGDTVRLAEFLHHDKPIILTLGYYECPMLCNLVFNGLSKSVAQLEWNAATEFEMLTVSVNPKETPELALAKKANYLKEFEKNANKPFDPKGWTFTVAEESQSRELADAVGFGYRYVPETKQYAHPAVTIILTPEGMISRYLYGIDHTRQDLKLALLEASEGKYGTTVDRLILYCFQYDPDAKGYVLFASNVMKLGGAMMVLAFAFFFGVMWVRKRAKQNNLAPANSEGKRVARSR